MDINNMELLNDSGLSSLSGFSYQIKVFILRLTQLQQGQRVEFETLDDVAVRSLSSKDSISDSCFKWKVDETSSIEVFQVKQTNVSESVRRQVLYNWLLAYQLKILGIHKVFTGTNSEIILHEITTLQNSLEKDETATKTQTIAELEAIYTSLDEQIKKQKNSEYDHKRFAEDEVKQRALLDRLQKIVEGKAEYAYLVNPIISLAVDLDKSISFNKYLIQETTTRELKKQRDRIRQQILANKSRFAIYSVSEKEQAVTLIKEYLSYYDCDFDGGSLSEIRRELRKVREEIRILQNGNDTEKINSLSADITQLYKSSIEVSELAEYDFRKSGFHISYLKNGNILQPQILDEESDSADQIKNYYTGSMARHTLMQLCGYLGFLRMLIKEDKYPLIPFLVIDHISKPFDNKNQKALGAILHGAYTNLQKSEMQIILFDDEDASSLGLTPDHSINLLGEDKSGFNPFYMTSKEDSPNAPEEVE